MVPDSTENFTHMNIYLYNQNGMLEVAVFGSLVKYKHKDII